jgi:hypothetical protein
VYLNSKLSLSVLTSPPLPQPQPIPNSCSYIGILCSCSPVILDSNTQSICLYSLSLPHSKLVVVHHIQGFNIQLLLLIPSADGRVNLIVHDIYKEYVNY